MQVNGTCEAWFNEIVNVIADPNNNYLSKESIKQGFESGMIFLQAGERLGKMFDNDPSKPTIKLFEELDKDNYKEEYFIFIANNRQFFGVKKDFSDNRFVNIKTLKLITKSGVQEKGQNIELKNELKLQKNQIYILILKSFGNYKLIVY